MKKSKKLKLSQLKVESFVTKKGYNNVLGGCDAEADIAGWSIFIIGCPLPPKSALECKSGIHTHCNCEA